MRTSYEEIPRLRYSRAERRARARTYLNDACYFRLPTGEIFEFYETSRLYILPLCDDDPAATPNTGALTAPKGRTKLFSFSADAVGADLTYRRLMHFSHDRALRSKDLVTGLDLEIFAS